MSRGRGHDDEMDTDKSNVQFNKHRQSLNYAQHVPAFLQQMASQTGVQVQNVARGQHRTNAERDQDESDASLGKEERARRARERAERDTEEDAPPIANLEDFADDIANMAGHKLDSLLRDARSRVQGGGAKPQNGGGVAETGTAHDASSHRGALRAALASGGKFSDVIVDGESDDEDKSRKKQRTGGSTAKPRNELGGPISVLELDKEIKGQSGAINDAEMVSAEDVAERDLMTVNVASGARVMPVAHAARPRREENPQADVEEVETGRHVFRKRVNSRLGLQAGASSASSSASTANRVGEKQVKKQLLSFAEDEHDAE